MAQYKLGLNKDGEITVCTVTKTGKVSGESVITEQVLDYAKEHLLFKIRQEQKDIMFAWKYPEQHKVLFLKLEEKDENELKEE